MTKPEAPQKINRVIICGGGIIGTSIAYFLSRKKVEALVIERSSIANAASGKAAGFLALDWCRGTAVDQLARRSFALHAELAASLAPGLNLDWGYRRLDTLSVAASEQRDFSSIARIQPPSWLGPRAAVHSQIGTEETTAQVDPAKFTQGMMLAAETGGAQLVLGTVEGVQLSGDGRRIRGVVVNGQTLEADAVVIAMGPWSILACQWLPLPGIYGLKGHSLVFRYAPSDPRALFVELETKDGQVETPEVMPRPDGTTYICGLSGEAPVPIDPAQVQPDPGAPQRLQALTAHFAPELGRSPLLAAQACYRPVTTDGLPLLGKVPGVEGAFVATGHSVWGILNGPASGEAMAELIVDGAASSVDLASFAPGRLPTLAPDQP